MASFFLPIDDDEGRSTPTQPQFPAPTRTPSRTVSVDLGRELKKKRLQERRKAAEARRNKRIKDQTEKLRLKHLKVDVIRDLKLHSSPVFAPTPSSPTSRGSAKTTTPTTSDYTSSNMFSSPEAKSPPASRFKKELDSDSFSLTPPLSDPPSPSRSTERALRRRASIDRRLEAGYERAEAIKTLRSLKASEKTQHVKEVCEKIKAAKKVQQFMRRYNAVQAALGSLDLKLVQELFGKKSQPFMGVAMKMRESSMLESAKSVVEALEKVEEGCPPDAQSARAFLSAMLMGLYPEDTLEDDGAKATELVRFLTKRLHAVVVNAPNPITPASLVAVSSTFSAFKFAFKEWQKKDKKEILDELRRSCKETWRVYLSEDEALKRLAEITEQGLTKSSPNPSVKLSHEHGKEGAKRHLIRLRKAFNNMLSDKEEGRKEMSALKAAVVADLDVELIRTGIDEQCGVGLETETKTEVETEATPPPSPSASARDAKNFMTNPKLVHRVMLQPSNKLSEITVDDSLVLETPRFGDDDEEVEIQTMNLEEGIQKQMERAFWDIVTEAISRNDFQGFNSAVDDLKTSVKKLVPSRDDLHRTIEEFTPATDSAPVARSNLLKIGSLLSKLESAVRSQTTTEWVETFASATITPALLIKSLKFLMKKASVCEVDLLNAKLAQIAPFIKAQGGAYERGRFEEAFGGFETGCENAFATKAWSESVEGGVKSKATFKTASVSGLVFSNASLDLPEVYLMDVDFIMRLRRLATVTGVANAIAIHCCGAAKVGVGVLTGEGQNLQNSELQANKDCLTLVLTSERVEEGDVLECALRLARGLLIGGEGEVDEEGLKGRVLEVLKGMDPVGKLIAKRTQSYFLSVVVREGANNGIPVSLRSGLMDVGGVGEVTDEIEEFAVKEADRVGLGLFGKDLSGEALKLRSVVENVWEVFGEVYLKKL
ncbi:hypothetical protein TrVE_jg14410 [Triparma verrucosa]|uniref:Uncharacterized protein n=1 Tax=Triparma verrucosa TaxID=1606542 RepID=A0A9W7EU57_9STRA|nr:hypothetical protein TrVE_jg14410 [Triparma verrucosa]